MRIKWLFVLIFLGFINRSSAQFNVTGIYTDYNTLWQSSTTAINPVKPELSHNMLAFTWKDITFSTGVNDGRLTAGGISFLPKNFRAFPIDAVYASTASGNTTYIGLGQLNDGVNAGGSTPAPFPAPAGPAGLASFLTDGPKGLDIGTGIANIAAGQLRFNLSSLGISASAIDDNVPDVVVTQIASPSDTQLDSIYFINASGVIVGNKLSINHNVVPIVGKWMPDFYLPSGAISIKNSERDIRLWAADLTSFGITAVNVSQAVALIYKLNGQSDVAFVAFNVPSISVATKLEITTQPSASVNPACCSSTGTTPITQQPVVQVKDASGNNILQADMLVNASIFSGPAGHGALTGTTTVTTNSSGQATFTNLIMPCETGNYVLQFTSSNLETANSSTVAVIKMQYYVKSSGAGNLSNLSNWSSVIDGSGSSPVNFNAGQDFILNNSNNDVAYSTGNNWTVNGKLIIPAGKTLTITGSTTTTLSCDISHAGTIESDPAGILILNGASTQSLGGISNLKNLTINNAAGVNMQGSTTVANTLTLSSGTITTTALLTVNGSISRTTGNINASGSGAAVTLSGSSAQTIPAAVFSGNIRSLLINNTTGVNLGSSLVVTNTFTLNNGIVTLSNFSITAGSISGGSPTAYVKTNGSGRLSVNVAAGGAVYFPVGNSSYNAVTITNNNLTTDQFAVRVLDEMFVNSTDGAAMPQSRITRSWNIQKAGANTGSGFGMSLNWANEQNSGVTTASLHSYQSGWIKQTSGSVTTTPTSLNYSGYTGGAFYFGLLDNAAVLPLVWKTFTAQINGKQVLLNWSTSSEEHTLEFTIERSQDNSHWLGIGKVDAAGTSFTTRAYTFTDLHPLPDINYYRIRQADIDAKYSYSAIRAIKWVVKDGIAIFGNPVKNKQLMIRADKEQQINIIDISGRTVLTKTINEGVQIIDLGHLSSGKYILYSSTSEPLAMLLN